MIEVNISGVEDVRKAVNNLAEKIENPERNLMIRVGDAVVDDIDERFMSRGYGTWPPLKPSTIARKKGNAMVLIDTGAMYASTRIKNVTQNTVEVDVPFGGARHDPKVPYYHQKPGRRQRKIIDITPALKAKLVAVVKKWVEDMAEAFNHGM